MTDEVEVQITIAAPPEAVFRYFTDPARLASWLGPESAIAAREGGEVIVRYPHGDVARGRVERLEAPTRIEFTWGYEEGKHGLAPGASRVSVQLEAVEQGTRVTLRHSGLLTAEQQTGQKAGWGYQLSRLSGLVTDEVLGSRVPSLTASYFQAWNEPDAALRGALLERCCAEDASFRDAMTAVQGRNELNQRIGVALMLSNGARLEAEGVPRHCKGAVLFGWRIVGPDGSQQARGVNFGELTAAGRFSTVVGFWQE